jgi:hypothetical protein
MLRATSLGAALFEAASKRAERGVPKHDISRWVLHRMDRPGVGVVVEKDTVDRVHQYLKRVGNTVKESA